MGRFRAHLYPNKEFVLYAVGTGLDLGYLTELGCQVAKQNVVELYEPIPLIFFRVFKRFKTAKLLKIYPRNVVFS